MKNYWAKLKSEKDSWSLVQEIEGKFYAVKKLDIFDERDEIHQEIFKLEPFIEYEIQTLNTLEEINEFFEAIEGKMKITRTLYNPYNHLVEVYFSDGVVLTGTYSLSMRNQTDSGIIGTFIDINFNDNEPYMAAYNDLARQSLLTKICGDIQKFTFKEFYK